MAGMIASAATGVMGSVIGKLAAMLNEKYKLAKDAERGIRFLQEELSSMDAVLQMLAEKDDDQIDPRVKDWRSKVRELSYDIEDCIDRFMLNHNHGASMANFVHKTIKKVKLFKDQEITEQIQELKSLVSEQSERWKRYYDINQCLLAPPQPVLLDPRVPALFQEAMDLVGIDAPRDEIIRLMKCEEKQHKVVSIYGIGGQGKTTLAMEVYRKVITRDRKINKPFDFHAFVSVSHTPDLKKLLRDILSQISKSHFEESKKLETDSQLISIVRECLQDKRYFILIDDIWSISVWELVRPALPVNDNGSRIITTTRIKAVANSCCTGITAQMYEATPLSYKDSEVLFFKRLYFRGEECPQDLMELSDDILKKCCGLPLAIISMAGLLANKSRTVEVWVDTLKSIAAAVDKNSPIDKMKRILLLSYFDLPHHLKSCLLYLSVFPEDYSIDCQQLILLWVAEGLIPGKNRESMEQLGRSYLNELINRSLVQPTKVGLDRATVKRCRVHDVILEFIVSKAVQENFVTIWNGSGFSENDCSLNKIRRLSIHKVISDRKTEEMAMTIKNGTHIRSINIFGSISILFTKHTSEFLSSQVLRVLNIDGKVRTCSPGRVKNFNQLKYLRIANCYCDLNFLEDAKKLQHLETIDLSYCNLEKIPSSIIQLQKLMRLFVGSWMQLPDGIENLQALEELSSLDLCKQSVKFIQGLGDLTNMRVLQISRWYPTEASRWYPTEVLDIEGHKKACISLLSKLSLSLRELHVSDPCVLATDNLHSMGPQISSLVNLTRLKICVVGDASKEKINILASLPMLLSLTVTLVNSKVGHSGIIYPRHVINRQGFQVLTKFNLRCECEAALEFETGAMPKLQLLKLQLVAKSQLEYGEGGLVLGLQNLVGLKHVAVVVDSDFGDHGVAEAMSLVDDISGAVRAHPNRPMLQFRNFYPSTVADGYLVGRLPNCVLGSGFFTPVTSCAIM